MISLIESPYANGLPGSKDSGAVKTSAAAAKAVENAAEAIREQCLSMLLCHDYTADELATVLCLDVHSVRSRCSELKAAGMIRESGERRENSHGMKTKVWTTRALKQAEIL